MPPDADLAAAFAEATRGGNGKVDDLALLREAVASGHVDPDEYPTLADELRRWAEFVCLLPQVEQEIALSERFAVMCDLYANAEEMLRAALAEALQRRRAARHGDAGPFVDWQTFWDREHSDAEWTYDDVLAKGRGHALYASHKTGKSLLMLWIAAQVVQREGEAVLYLDYEMGESDLFDRLDDMGYGPSTDFSRLRYALLPSLPPLDTKAGAEALCDLIDGVQEEMPGKHLTVVIDTISRAVQGEENSADTFRAFYSCTGIELKRRAVTWVRLDHAGKDKGQGQRGSSGKGDDVDVVWRLSKTENGLELKRELSRMSWVPELVNFKRSDNPLTYLRMVFDWPEGTQEVALQMDRLKVPVEVTVKAAQESLHKHGVSRRTKLVGAAVRWRKQREQGVGKRPPDHTESAADDGRGGESPCVETSRETRGNAEERFPETSYGGF
jgi:hypothetical protein